jgi:hypothetical protein
LEIRKCLKVPSIDKSWNQETASDLVLLQKFQQVGRGAMMGLPSRFLRPHTLTSAGHKLWQGSHAAQNIIPKLNAQDFKVQFQIEKPVSTRKP